MNNVKNALTRKFGPLPAWGWLGILAVGVIYYRRKFGAVSSGTGTGSVVPAGPEPGTGEQVLQPGESIYDPTAGGLTTAPGGGGSGDTSGGSSNGGDPNLPAFTSAINALATALGQNAPAGQTNATGGGNTNQGGHKKAPKLTKGGVRAPFGHNRPKNVPKGYTVKGQGHGFWEFVPKHAAKSKGQQGSGKTASQNGTGQKSRGRSDATTRNKGGGRTGGKQKQTQKGEIQSSNWRAATPTAEPSRARQKPKVPVTTTVVRQRAQATHPAPKPTAHSAAPAARPSAPPPRTQRAPAKAPPAPAARKRK